MMVDARTTLWVVTSEIEPGVYGRLVCICLDKELAARHAADAEQETGRFAHVEAWGILDYPPSSTK